VLHLWYNEGDRGMKNEIAKVMPYSIAEEVGIEIGDKLVSINENEVKDIIDYKFLITDETLLIEVEKKDGEIWEIEIEKDYDEDLGIVFREAILDKPRSCHNKCVFCFIDQLPEGMRETLYFKDDDSRLSFLQGNFLTLTNMSEDDINRIIKYRISPINVSVHTTNPQLRIKMLNNRFAGNIYDILKKLAEAHIKINTQIVCCPGLNDNEELVKTVEDLYKLYPSVENVAIVPLGVTKHRDNLPQLQLFHKESAKMQIELVSKLQEKYKKEFGTPFARLSDEFYIVADVEIPEEDHYEGYEQLEDGIGMIRLLLSTIEDSLSFLQRDNKGSFTMVTGTSAYPIIHEVASKIMKVNPKINIDVVKVENDFFGKTITVAGLLTGKDIIEALKNRELGEYIIIPSNVLRRGYELGNTEELILLDDYTVADLKKILNKEIIVCDYTGEDLIDLINQYTEED
jgi:putative radical SAM enzyme (TIGR03279 family)